MAAGRLAWMVRVRLAPCVAQTSLSSTPSCGAAHFPFIAVRRISLLARLQTRGLVANITAPELDQALERSLPQTSVSSRLSSAQSPHSSSKPYLTFYCGFDPTARSLHIGNLMALVVMAHLRAAGHAAIAVVGGATGRVGDPSGRLRERDALGSGVIEGNMQGIAENIARVLRNAENMLMHIPTAEKGVDKGSIPDGAPPPLVVLNNMDWFENMGLLTFLREVGRHSRLGVMLKRDSVRSRLDSEEGLSFCEFTYQLLQAYDFLHLFDTYGCSLQVSRAPGFAI